MIPDFKISKYIALLISETKANTVSWEASHNKNLDSIEGEQDVIGKVFITKFKDKSLRLYKYVEPVQIDDLEYIKQVFYKLEFIDDYDKNIWTFPFYIRELQDLFETVQIKTNNLDKYFDSIIPDAPEETFDF